MKGLKATDWHRFSEKCFLGALCHKAPITTLIKKASAVVACSYGGHDGAPTESHPAKKRKYIDNKRLCALTI